MAEQAAERAFAVVAARIAILVVGLEIHTFALAARLARRAGGAALPITARRGCSSRGGFTHRRAIAAMVHVRARIDTGRAAGDEWQLAVELALAGLTRGRRVGRRHTDFAAIAAIGGVTRGVHAGRATGGLGAASQRARSAFTELPRAAGLSACAAVLGVRAAIDAAARAVVVARAAIHGTLSVVAEGSAVGHRGANLAARTAVVDVGIELLAAAVARAVAGRTGQGAHRALADGTGVRSAGAGLAAITAVARIAGQVHTRAVAIAGPRGTSRSALCARAHLVLLALGSAGAAVGRILVGLHARIAALRVADIAGRTAVAGAASRGSIGGGVADVLALSAVRRTTAGIDATRAALLVAIRTVEVAAGISA